MRFRWSKFDRTTQCTFLSIYFSSVMMFKHWSCLSQWSSVKNKQIVPSIFTRSDLNSLEEIRLCLKAKLKIRLNKGSLNFTVVNLFPSFASIRHLPLYINIMHFKFVTIALYCQHSHKCVIWLCETQISVCFYVLGHRIQDEKKGFVISVWDSNVIWMCATTLMVHYSYVAHLSSKRKLKCNYAKKITLIL